MSNGCGCGGVEMVLFYYLSTLYLQNFGNVILDISFN